jgi:hypothetical protein
MLTTLLRTAPVVNVPSSPPAAAAATSSISGRPSSTRPESTRNMPRRILAQAGRLRSFDRSARSRARSTCASAAATSPRARAESAFAIAR